MAIRDDMEDVQEAVINELITENGITNTLADGQVTETKIANGAVTAAKLDRDYLESTGGSVSGNLLVGKTSANTYNNTNGIELQSSGLLVATRAGIAQILNREDSDGDIAAFRKDGTTVGRIGTNIFSDLFIAGDGTNNVGVAFDGNAVLPTNGTGARSDNVKDLGSSGVRFDDIYATNGSIQTSDENDKQDIEALSEAEQRVAIACKGLLRKFRWKSAVEEKGDEARIHFGIIAQDLQAAFEAEGLDAGRYAMFISSTWTDEETGEEKTRLGVRYSELLAFIISAI